jgi:hypothetical protein
VNTKNELPDAELGHFTCLSNQSILKEISPDFFFQIFIGRPDSEAPILWPPDVTSQVIGKDSDDGKD